MPGTGTLSGISCTACNVFGERLIEIPGNKNARLVRCGACHRGWFRDSLKSFKWRQVTNSEELNNLQSKFETIWV